ncbi:MAG: metal-dependent transcriptional regulator [Acidobacteria bacterium]|nr:metal-dependent transcriptional regulator [Acidobacteriota bacterium]
MSAWTHDLLARLRRRRVKREQEHGDNALKHLLKESHAGRAGTLASLKGTLRLGDRAVLRVLDRLRVSGLAAMEGDTHRLTADGEQRARHLIRAHRLLERYLADEARMPVTAVHGMAERLEHQMSEAETDRLSAALGHPERDPHGDPIPSAGEAPDDLGEPLASLTPGEVACISHLEDEPATIFRALVAHGLRPGLSVTVARASTESLELLADGRSLTLPVALAGNVFVTREHDVLAGEDDTVRLSDVAHEEEASVVSLSPACQGFTRRRLLDLGFTPGTRVRPVLESFAGDPRAYRVRGTTVALRHDQARHVTVRSAGAHGHRTAGTQDVGNAGAGVFGS